MKLTGTFYEIKLLLNDTLIEFQVIKDNEIKYKANPMDFSEIEFDLSSFLEENNVFLPKNRINIFLQELEGEYLNLIQKQSQNREKQLARERKSSEIPSTKHPKRDIQKILLVGGGGKTSIYQVIFEGKLPYETQSLNPTRGVEKHKIKFPSLSSSPMGGQQLSIWDFGKNLPSSADYKNASLLLFIIDAYDVNNYDKYREQLHNSISMMKSYGTRPKYLNFSQSNVFCFINKIDRFTNASDQFKSLVEYFRFNPETKEKSFQINFFATSIFNSSIYSAWAKVIELLLPKSSKLNQLSNKLRDDLGLYTTMILEKRIGLPICASKTLLDDAALVGSTNRLLILIDKVLPQYELASLESLKIATANGILEIKIFEEFYVLVLIYPPHVNLNIEKNKQILEDFIQNMRVSI